jgi:hypothetical protein
MQRPKPSWRICYELLDCAVGDGISHYEDARISCGDRRGLLYLLTVASGMATTAART